VRRRNQILYHYTDANGLLGIVKSRELWATHILHLNDSSEYSHAVQVAAKQTKKGLLSAELTEALKMLVPASTVNPEEVNETAPCLPFVVSLSQNGDQLSQWRAYCPDGNGFSIGFKYSQFD
jgi:hypothetical protein